MKTLKESLLSNIETPMAKGDEWIKRVNTIGGKMSITTVGGAFFNRINKYLSKQAITKATKNCYLSDSLKELSEREKLDPILTKFIQWIENQSFDDMYNIYENAIKLKLFNKDVVKITVGNEYNSFTKSDYYFGIEIKNGTQNDCFMYIWYKLNN